MLLSTHHTLSEHQLRRVESAYLTECKQQRHEPHQSVEERMLQYQRECDVLSDARVREEVERFKAAELALMRTEEQAKSARACDELRTALLCEQQQQTERLHERSRELELAFVSKRTELEASLFETRQALFRDMEALRVKHAELQVKIETDARAFAAERKRLDLWADAVRAQEANTERTVAQAMREQEHALELERAKAKLELKVREDALAAQQAELEAEREAIASAKQTHKSRQADVTRLEEALEVCW